MYGTVCQDSGDVKNSINSKPFKTITNEARQSLSKISRKSVIDVTWFSTTTPSSPTRTKVTRALFWFDPSTPASAL